MSKSNYVRLSKEEIDRAKRTDLASLLISMGETVKRSGSEHEWSDNGRKVTLRGCVWFHQYDMTGGDAIDFAQRFFGKTFPEAVVFLNGGSSAQLIQSLPAEKEKKPFSLPPKNDNMRRVFGYLCGGRGIDRDVLHTFVRRNMVYESADYHNAVFVGYDKGGIARHAHKRGSHSSSHFKGNVDSSNPAFSFHWNGTSGSLYLFEAPIDMLSFISMNRNNWQQHSYAAACSVSDTVLFQCMKDIGNIDKVFLCMDNDSAGQEADRRIAAKLREQGVEFEILVPQMKDWNEDLTSGCGVVQLQPEPEESEEEVWMALSL
jgi:hypothetical protein